MAHKILETEQSPNSPLSFLVWLFRFGAWTLDRNLDSGLSKNDALIINTRLRPAVDKIKEFTDDGELNPWLKSWQFLNLVAKLSYTFSLCLNFCFDFWSCFAFVLYWKFDLGLTIAQHLVHFSLTVQSIESFDWHPCRQKVFLFSLISTQSIYIIMAAKTQTFLVILHVILFISKASKGDKKLANGPAISKLLMHFWSFYICFSKD